MSKINRNTYKGVGRPRKEDYVTYDRMDDERFFDDMDWVVAGVTTGLVIAGSLLALMIIL